MFPNKLNEENRNENNWRIRTSGESRTKNRNVQNKWRTMTVGYFIKLSILDVNQLMQEVGDGKNDYERYIEKEMLDDRIVFIIKIFVASCLEPKSDQDEIFNLITNKKLILNLEIFLMKLTLLTVETRAYYNHFLTNSVEFFNNMCELLNCIIKNAPTKACQILPRLFKTITFCLPIYETDYKIEVSNQVKDKVVKIIEELEIHRSYIGEDEKKKIAWDKKLSVISPGPSRFYKSPKGDANGKLPTITLRRLARWSNIQDVNKIIQQVSDDKEDIQEYIENEMQGDRIVLIIKIFAKFCSVSEINQVEIVNLITNRQLISKLESFIKTLSLEAVENRAFYNNFWVDTDDFFNNMCDLLKAIIICAPSKASQILPKLLETLTVCLPTFENRNHVKISNQIKGKMAKLISELKLHMSELEADEKENLVYNEKFFESLLQYSLNSTPGFTTIEEQKFITHQNLPNEDLKAGNKQTDTVGFMQIQAWSLKEDSNEVVQDIMKHKEAFEKYLKRSNAGNVMVLLFKILAKLNISSPSHKEIFLSMALNEKFLRNIEIFFMKLPLQTAELQKYYVFFWSNIPEFFSNFTKVFNYVIDTPSIQDLQPVLRLFKTIETFLPIFESEHNIQLSNEVKVMIAAMHEIRLKSNQISVHYF